MRSKRANTCRAPKKYPTHSGCSIIVHDCYYLVVNSYTNLASQIYTILQIEETEASALPTKGASPPSFPGEVTKAQDARELLKGCLQHGEGSVDGHPAPRGSFSGKWVHT